MITKNKKIIILSLSFVALVFIGWIVLELTIPDVKGKKNPVKNLYYQVTGIFPVKPAVRLAVPYYRQRHALSCETVSLLMALKYRGVNVTEDQLIQQLPVSDPGPRHPDNTWGDPNLGFVGDINGGNAKYGLWCL